MGSHFYILFFSFSLWLRPLFFYNQLSFSWFINLIKSIGPPSAEKPPMADRGTLFYTNKLFCLPQQREVQHRFAMPSGKEFPSLPQDPEWVPRSAIGGFGATSAPKARQFRQRHQTVGGFAAEKPRGKPNICLGYRQ